MPRKRKTPSFTDPVTAADLAAKIEALARENVHLRGELLAIRQQFDNLLAEQDRLYGFLISTALRLTDEGLSELLAHVCAMLEKSGRIERQQLVELAQKLEQQGHLLVHMQRAFAFFSPDDAVQRIGQTVVRLESLAAAIARINRDQPKMPGQQVE